MGRPPVVPAEKKIRIVLSVLQGGLTVAEAARREKVREQSVGNWKRQFLEAGKSKLSTREQRLEDEVAELTTALGEAAVEIRVWKKSAEGPVGPFEDLEVIRLDAGMPTSRFVDLIGVPERSCRRWQAKPRTDRPRARADSICTVTFLHIGALHIGCATDAAQ